MNLRFDGYSLIDTQMKDILFLLRTLPNTLQTILIVSDRRDGWVVTSIRGLGVVGLGIYCFLSF